MAARNWVTDEALMGIPGICGLASRHSVVRSSSSDSADGVGRSKFHAGGSRESVGESRESVAHVIILKGVADLSVSKGGIDVSALECAATPGDPEAVYRPDARGL